MKEAVLFLLRYVERFGDTPHSAQATRFLDGLALDEGQPEEPVRFGAGEIGPNA